LPPGPQNPRNSEGDFVVLRDGSVLFVYTRFTSGRGGDHDEASLVSRISHDQGATWSGKDESVLANEGKMNVMSVSLLRLDDGRLALSYLRKNSLADCRPYLRFSSDEARTWGDPIEIISEREPGYYVQNNDRVIQTAEGRLIAPVAQHCGFEMGEKWTARANLCCYLSDDRGRTWRRGRQSFSAIDAAGRPVVTQEPGVVQLADGRLLMFIRTDAGQQYFSYSSDGGETWSKPGPSGLSSPLSPASIKRIPGSPDLLAVYNDRGQAGKDQPQRRTPLVMAISKDGGRTWGSHRALENRPDGWFCYTAIEFVDRHVLLAYFAGAAERGEGLATTRLARVPLNSLHEAAGQ
jgi:hypothetical protein